VSAASPGMSDCRTNTITETTNSSGIETRIRLATSLVTGEA
jgi:hypothetical protein